MAAISEIPTSLPRFAGSRRSPRSEGTWILGDWACDYGDTARVRIADRSLFVLHDLKSMRIDPAALGIDVVISGHSHVPKIDTVGGVLYVNPGSAGRRRFRLPITLATLDVTPDGLRPTILDLGDG